MARGLQGKHVDCRWNYCPSFTPSLLNSDQLPLDRLSGGDIEVHVEYVENMWKRNKGGMTSPQTDSLKLASR